jgi:modulator of FtsH protease
MALDPRTQTLPGERAGGGLSADAVRVLRNTYALLGMTLAFSAVTAYVSTAMGINLHGLGLLPILAIFFGLSFLVHKTADSGWGLVSVFLFTGFLGVMIAPLLSRVIGLNNGGSLVAAAFATTAAAFVAMSAFTLMTRKDFGFLSGFIVVGIVVAIVAMIANYYFLHLPFVTLAISAGIALLGCAAILWQTSAIVHGGERNYIRATTTLFVSFYNIFSFLLQMFGLMGDD